MVAPSVRFGEFTLDRGGRRFTRRGVPVHLSPKAFRLLELLIDAAPDAVSKEQLYEAVWPGLFVEEANLPNLVKELRKAIEDDSRNPRFIRTVYGFGYSFDGAAISISEGPSSQIRFLIEWAGSQHLLSAGRNIIGRDIDVDVRIDSAGVSRKHAVITIVGANASIDDLGSKNGTYLNGARVLSSMPLNDGDEIRLGSAVFRLRVIAPAEPTATEAPKS